MDGYERLDLDEIDFAPMEHSAERLRLLTLDEAYRAPADAGVLRRVAATRTASSRPPRRRGGASAATPMAAVGEAFSPLAVVLEELVVLIGHAEQFGDHQRRDRQ
ncbi:DUF6417 family protein [Streptomyces sp. NPDC005859]|uniref:DUF6417 family protein n=1 Tax=Streptomyces sp. NPDC005859 TaxID=3157170 RepID=UPI0033BFFD7F